MRKATVTLRSGEVVRDVVLGGASNGGGRMNLYFRSAEPEPMTRAYQPRWFSTDDGEDDQVVKSIVWED